MKNFYVLCLEDYSLPGFCSGEKQYWGTKDDFLNFYTSARKIGMSAANLTQLFTFVNSNHNKSYNKNHEFIDSATVLEEREIIIREQKWTHLNVWKHAYYMQFEECNVSIAWIRYKRKYYRCIKPDFFKLKYSGDENSKYNSISNYWGQPGFFKQDGEWLKSNLYIVDKQFESKNEALQEVENFDFNTLNFTEIINEIFGDG